MGDDKVSGKTTCPWRNSGLPETGRTQRKEQGTRDGLITTQGQGEFRSRTNVGHEGDGKEERKAIRDQ